MSSQMNYGTKYIISMESALRELGTSVRNSELIYVRHIPALCDGGYLGHSPSHAGNIALFLHLHSEYLALNIALYLAMTLQLIHS